MSVSSDSAPLLLSHLGSGLTRTPSSSQCVQDWPLLGPAVEKAIKDFDARVEAQRPAAEARWRTATLAKNTTGAALELAAFSRKTATEVRCAAMGQGGWRGWSSVGGGVGDVGM